jgi:hypothetical protein
MLRRRLARPATMDPHSQAALVHTDPSGHNRSHSLSLHRLAGFDYADPDHAYLVTICSRHTTAPVTNVRLAREVVASFQAGQPTTEYTAYTMCAGCSISSDRAASRLLFQNYSLSLC